MIKDAILSQQPSVSIAWSSLDRSVDPSCIRKTTLSHHILWIIISKKIQYFIDNYYSFFLKLELKMANVVMWSRLAVLFQ